MKQASKKQLTHMVAKIYQEVGKRNGCSNLPLYDYETICKQMNTRSRDNVAETAFKVYMQEKLNKKYGCGSILEQSHRRKSAGVEVSKFFGSHKLLAEKMLFDIAMKDRLQELDEVDEDALTRFQNGEISDDVCDFEMLGAAIGRSIIRGRLR